MKIWTIDAFTKDAYQGNPAAVMVVDDFPKHAQAIAAEMNLSETVFLKRLRGNQYHIRWFTPVPNDVHMLILLSKRGKPRAFHDGYGASRDKDPVSFKTQA